MVVTGALVDIIGIPIGLIVISEEPLVAAVVEQPDLQIMGGQASIRMEILAMIVMVVQVIVE